MTGAVIAYGATVCSILDLDPNDTPNFADCGFFEGLDSWLKERGQRCIRVSLTGGQDPAAMWFGYPANDVDCVILWGESPRLRADGGTKQHAVVGKVDGYGFAVEHDPHPDRTGLKSILGFGWIVPN